MEGQGKFAKMREDLRVVPSDNGLSPKLREKIGKHKSWLDGISRETPSHDHPFRVGIYIRFFNQTKYEDYLDCHIGQFEEMLAQCPNWKLIDFYIDRGGTAPHIEASPELCRLLEDCASGKVDLIITQKVRSISKYPFDVTLCARLLAVQTPPVGIYFISEDIFTLASYYMKDLRDTGFLPYPDWKALPDDEGD